MLKHRKLIIKTAACILAGSFLLTGCGEKKEQEEATNEDTIGLLPYDEQKDVAKLFQPDESGSNTNTTGISGIFENLNAEESESKKEKDKEEEKKEEIKPTKTKKTLWDYAKHEAIGIQCVCLDETGNIPENSANIRIYKSPEGTYINKKNKACSLSFIIKDGKTIHMDNKGKTYSENPLTEENKSEISNIQKLANLIQSKEIKASTPGKVISAVIEGKEYYAERFTVKYETRTYIYDENEDLIAVKWDSRKGGAAYLLKNIETNIPDNILEIPEGFKDIAYDPAVEIEEAARRGIREADKKPDTFRSEQKGFSFLYNPEHTVYITEDGSAELLINNNADLIGLYVTVLDSSDTGWIKERTEEIKRAYEESLFSDPQRLSINIRGKKLTGILYYAKDTEGNIIRRTELRETRGNRVIEYRTAEQEGSMKSLECMGMAAKTLRFDADAYGDDIEIEEYDISANMTRTLQIKEPPVTLDEKAPVNNPEIVSAFTFETQPGDLVLSSEFAAQVYPSGNIEGDYFSVKALKRAELTNGNAEDELEVQKEKIRAFLTSRMANAIDDKLLQTDSRELKGIEYKYAAMDESKLIYGATYYEEVNDTVYEWQATWSQDDTKAHDAMIQAIETFGIRKRK